MNLTWIFFVENVLIGVALAMDAFSVSLANGLHQPCMCYRKMSGVAGIFAAFQAAMPLIGWFCVHTAARYFTAFAPLIPWIALVLLGFIGGKMLYEGITCNEEEDCDCKKTLSFSLLLVQGVATSIDALSVGFTIAEYNVWEALVAVALIAVVTFIICFAGLEIGKRFGTKLSGKAGILGGCILILIGLEIFITSFF